MAEWSKAGLIPEGVLSSASPRGFESHHHPNITRKDMTMLNFITKTVSAAAKVTVGLPIAVVADIATLGGELADKKQSFSGDVLDSVQKDLEDSLD